MEVVTLCNLHGFLLKQMDTFSHTLWLLQSNEELSLARDDGNTRSPYEPITSRSSHRAREPLFVIAWRKSGKSELISRSIRIQPTKKRSTGYLHHSISNYFQGCEEHGTGGIMGYEPGSRVFALWHCCPLDSEPLCSLGELNNKTRCWRTLQLPEEEGNGGTSPGLHREI